MAPWPVGLVGGWLVFVVTTLGLNAVSWPPMFALGTALASFVVAERLLPAVTGRVSAGVAPDWDLPLRIVAALALVLTVTHLASWLGPRLSGALTPFPVALSILMAFTHSQQGTATAITFLRAFLAAMWSFALFCFVVAVAAAPLGRSLAFVLALGAQLIVHALVLWRMQAKTEAFSPSRRGTSRCRTPSD